MSKLPLSRNITRLLQENASRKHYKVVRKESSCLNANHQGILWALLCLKESFQLYHLVADDFMRKSRQKRRGIATLLVEENHTPNVLHRKRGL